MKRLGYILAFFAMLTLSFNEASAQKGISTPNQNSSGSTLFCNVFIPNAFTPNGDNINDLFEVKHGENCQVLEFNMKIFDRWGRLIYETNSMEKEQSWNGMADGKEVLQGVYMWAAYAKVKTLQGTQEVEDFKKQGTVVVIR